MQQKFEIRAHFALGLLLFLAGAFLYPRWLLTIWPASHPWTSFFYTYGFASLYTGSGLLLALRTGACQMHRPRDRFWFWAVIFGFVYFFTMHGLWILLALHLPFRGNISP